MLPCRTCAYRSELPGDVHSRCTFNWNLKPQDIPANQGSTRTARWFRFPFNYDPVWGPDHCAGHATEKDPANVAPSDPVADLLSLLR